MSRRSGFTFFELMVTMALAVIVAAIALPRLSDAAELREVRSAATAVRLMLLQARASAIGSGRNTTFQVVGNRIWLVATPRRTPGACTGCTLDTVGVVRDLAAEYGVTVDASTSGYTLDGRGLVVAPGTDTRVVVRRAGYADTVTVTGFGRIVR